MRGTLNIIFIIACYFAVNGIYVPALPNVAEYFHTSGEIIRETMTFFQLGALISCIIAGFLADSVGKKNFLLLGLCVALIGSVLCLITPNVTFLIIGRFLQGMGAATGFMMGFALAVDLYKPEQTLKIIALNGIIVSCISVLTPAIGGIITSQWDWHATFIFIIPFFVIALINSATQIPKEANIHREPFDLRQGILDYVKISTNRNYICYAILNALGIGTLTFSMSFLPFFYKDSLHVQANEIGILIGLSIFLSFGLSSIYSIRMYKKFGIDKSIYLGLFTSFAGASLMILTAYAFPRALMPNIIGTILFYLGFGTFYSGSISKSLRIFMDLTTKASSLRTIMISFFSFIGGLTAQYANEKNLMHLAIVLMATTLLNTLFFISRGEPRQSI
jgi:DHA1 family bicyclomycin/chloramphenicol resistance-like MFS transporter